MATKTTTAIGRIARVTGPVVDIEFPHDAIPDIYNALQTTYTLDGVEITLTLEVAQHLGDDLVRAIALKPTDGLVRGQEVSDTGAPISVPVGDVTKGKVFNVLGEVLNGDGKKIEIKTTECPPELKKELTKRFLNTIAFHEDGKICSGELTQADYAGGTLPADSAVYAYLGIGTDGTTLVKELSTTAPGDPARTATVSADKSIASCRFVHCSAGREQRASCSGPPRTTSSLEPSSTSPISPAM